MLSRFPNLRIAQEFSLNLPFFIVRAYHLIDLCVRVFSKEVFVFSKKKKKKKL